MSGLGFNTTYFDIQKAKKKQNETIEMEISQLQKEIFEKNLKFDEESSSSDFKKETPAYFSLLAAHQLDMAKLQTKIEQLKNKLSGGGKKKSKQMKSKKSKKSKRRNRKYSKRK